MNAIRHLEQEHKEIKDLFNQFEEAGERAYKTKQSVAEKVIEEIHSHTQEEETIFYPAVLLKEKKKPRTSSWKGSKSTELRIS
jgi:hypothetical protein